MPGESRLHTDIASHDADHIWIRGIDLTADLMGRMSYTDVVFLLIAGRLPDDAERRLMDAVLVSLMEHGLTLSAVTARATFWAAPESIQGAVSAGLLGAGSVVLGSMEACGQMLTSMDRRIQDGAAIEVVAADVVQGLLDAGQRIPGVGHAIHKEADPRAQRLFQIADEVGRVGPHRTNLEAVAQAGERQTGRHLPINATGAVAAILLELGIPWQLHRGFALISRTPGLLAHLGEELESPLTPALRKVLFDT